MSDHTIEFEATEGGLVLANAILLYRPEVRHLNGTQPAFASFHPVEQNAGQPVIAAGRPLTRADLRKWTEALGRAAAPEILPENVLVAHPDLLAWWVPEQVRRAYFNLTAPPQGLKALAHRTTVPVPYPAHVFLATRGSLGVYALPESRRPGGDTPILHSPVLNVFVDGRLCWGNIPRPRTLAVASIAEFERAVFDSWSTHPNHGQELTVTGKRGLVRLWDDLAARGATRFPTRRLKPFGQGKRRTAGAPPITLGKLIAGLGR